MKIDVKSIAKLSNLTINPTEEKEFEEQLESIIEYINTLNKIDTSDVVPTAQTTGLINVFRDDVSSDDTLTQEQALSGTYKTHNGLFVVDKLVDTTS